MTRAAATLTNANKLAQRYKPLAAVHAISGQAYDDAVAAAREAQADLETARVNLNYTKVRSPISGHIGRSLYTEGALVTNGQTSYLTTIQQLDPIYVDVSESSQDLLSQRRALANGKLKAVGDNAAAVKLQLEDGSNYPLEGKLEFSEVTVDQSTGSITMRAAFPNPDHVLLPGMLSTPVSHKVWLHRASSRRRKRSCTTPKVSRMSSWLTRITPCFSKPLPPVK